MNGHRVGIDRTGPCALAPMGRRDDGRRTESSRRLGHNTAALLFHLWPGMSWLGVYLMERPDGDLVVGPFQGKPACTRIRIGQGVVGTSAATKSSLAVPNVSLFPGHIVCAPGSRSELVVPSVDGMHQVRAVWDIDSPNEITLARSMTCS